MKRENLIQRLVARKLKTANSDKPRFCVCLARALCFANGQRPAQAQS